MNPPAILDITRLFSRRFLKIDTGIDRVERGIFEVLSEDYQNAYLIRFGERYFLLNAARAKQILSRPKRSRLLTYLQLRFAAIRRGKNMIDASGYARFYHLGHIRHAEKFWTNLKSQGVKITILIHDVIPLDFPETCRTDQLQVFKSNFAQWVHMADQILTPSNYSRDRILAHARPRCPVQVQPLALRELERVNALRDPASFLVVGTIEPRKNHKTLLDAWQVLHRRLGDQCPKLWIIGARGWANREVFKWLDNSPLMGKYVFELGAVDDIEMQEYFSRATAILFPSLSEGFGLPFFEAVKSGQDILASNIPAFREAVTSEDAKLLISPTAIQQWAERIANFEAHPYKLTINLPASWHEYFTKINALVTSPGN